MEYQWKMSGLYPVSAQTAGEELERIYAEKCSMTASVIVDESRPEEAPLHPCFEWNDPVAAERWREHQARGIVNCIVVKSENAVKEPVQVRAFIHARESYHPLNVALESKDLAAEMMSNALSDMKNFTAKYKTLLSLKPVITTMEKTIKEMEKENSKK